MYMNTIDFDSVNKKDNVAGFFTSALFFVLLFFLLKFISYANIAEEEPLEDIIEIEKKVPDQITMHKFETSEKQGGGSGTPTDAPLQKDYSPQMEKTLRDENSTAKETAAQGESNHSNQNKSSDNKASTTVDSDLAFKSGGDGGGDKGGKGKGFGNDNGNGDGPGKGEGKKARIRLNDPNTNNISSNESCKISLKLSINAEGDVVRAENIGAKTTTTNQTIINQVIANVKSQVKYNAREGASLETVFLTVNISAN